MSRHASPFIEYHCANDCRMEGCPGHRLRIVYLITSDHIGVEIDPDETARVGDDPRMIFDENAFHALVDLAIMERELNSATTNTFPP